MTFPLCAERGETLERMKTKTKQTKTPLTLVQIRAILCTQAGTGNSIIPTTM